MNPPTGFAMNTHSEQRTRRNAEDLRGLGRLATDAVTGVTDMVEAMHRTIGGLAPPLGQGPTGPTSGIAGLVYRSVRGVTRLVGGGVDMALSAAAPLLGESQPAALRAAAVAALNGVYGDHLARTGNPLAISMHLCHANRMLHLDRKPLPTNELGPHPLLLLHGLCMNDQQWQRNGHDHGAALARDLGYTPIYLHYNSGRHVVDNGRELAHLLQQLFAAWPQPMQSLTLLGHSMGGLVARSAVHRAQLESLPWLKSLRAMAFLGTPHHGAPLARAGHWVDTLIGFSPYSAPLQGLGESRSAGIKDLRFGHVAEALPSGKQRLDLRRPVPLPIGVHSYAIAATRGASDLPNDRLPTDGLVPVASALGTHDNPTLALDIPDEQRWIAHGRGHFDLLNDPEVYERLKSWLQGSQAQ